MYESEKYCKNCGQHLILDQRFCHSCGQKADTHRINMHFLIHEIQHSIFHVDKGILYTLKHLFTRPGHMLREYLEGRRQQHFKPVLTVIILGSLCGLLSHFLNPSEEPNFADFDASANNSQAAKYIDLKGFSHFLFDIFKWIIDHLAFTILLMIPFFALGFYLGFRKYRIYYAEWLIVMCYLAAQSLAVYFLFLPVDSLLGNDYIGWFFVISTGLMVWTLLQFFHNRSRIKVLLRTAWSFTLAYFFGFIYLNLVIMIILVAGVMIYGNENILKEILSR